MSEQLETITPTETVPTDSMTPISPSEAARALSQYRWQRDGVEKPAPEPVAESRAPLDYEPMRVQHPIAREEPGSELEIKDAANELANRRETSLVDAEISYLEADTGKPKPPNETVSAEQAAADLARYRQGMGETEQAMADLELQQVIDALRAGDQQQSQAQPVEQQQAQPQAEQATQPQATADDEVARALSNPKVLEAVQQHISQAEQQAAAQAQYYAQAVQHNAQATMAAMLHSYPELVGLSDPSQLHTAIQVVGKSNPARAQQMIEHIRATQNVVAEAQRVQAAQAQAHQQAAAQQWNQYTKAQDTAFDKFCKQNNVSDQEVLQIRAEALAALHEDGLNDQQIEHLWNHGELRSFYAQKRMFESAKFRLEQKARAEAQKSINHKRDRTPPTVQAPGAGSVEMASREDYGLRALSEKVSRTTGRDQIRAAAELVAARRARSR